MAMDIRQAEAIARRVEETGLITSVGFQDRYLDLMEIVKDELPKHRPGGLVYGAWVGGIPGVWWWQKKSTCGGQLVEQNIHLLDGLRWLYGEPAAQVLTDVGHALEEEFERLGECVEHLEKDTQERLEERFRPAGQPE